MGQDFLKKEALSSESLMILKQFNSLERLIFRWELAEPYQIGTTCCFVLNTNENLFPKMENPKARKKG